LLVVQKGKEERLMGRSARRLGFSTVAPTLTPMPASAGKAEIIRGEYDVPHVDCVSLNSTSYGVGNAMRQNRLWQHWDISLSRQIALANAEPIIGLNGTE
jgi:acyl-homoserine lactone acylase PvdQ